MFRLKKIVLFILTSLVLVALSACTLGQADQPTPTPVDLNAVKTSAAATAFVELTKIAAAVPPTSTATIPASDTPTQSPTDTLAPGAPTLTLTATQLIIGGATDITPIPSFTPLPSGGGSSGPVCKNSQYGGDLTIPDGTVFKPWEKFTKGWNVKNTGTCKWDEGFYFAGLAGPPSMTAHPYYFQYKKDYIGPGESVNIYINMYAPGDPGDYVAHWHMYDDLGKPFGGDFTVVIKVVK